MKRYRILSFDFDSRALLLKPVQDEWEERVKELHIENQEKIISGLVGQFGEFGFDRKLENFRELGQKPFSVLAFHNKFLNQIRNSYVVGSYYPALTGAAALGERILNYMMLLLREYHRDAPEYKKLYRKKSFDNWDTAIDALESWGELLPSAAEKFRGLNGKRNNAIHFNPETDRNDKELALDAILLLQETIQIQFSSFGAQLWCFNVPGETYIKKEWEDKPFVKEVFVPNSILVGPRNKIIEVMPRMVVDDQQEYPDKEITDEEFIRQRQIFQDNG